MIDLEPDSEVSESKRGARDGRAAAAGASLLMAGAWIAGAVLLGSGSIVQGQPLACAAETVGELSVQAGVRCECVRVAGGTITGAPSGYAWDCGVLRGRLNQLVSPEPDAYQGPLPEGIIVETEDGLLRPRQPWIAPQ